MDVSQLLHHIYIKTGIIAVAFLFVNNCLGFYSFKKLNITFKHFLYFLFFSLGIELAARAFAYSSHNNLPLLHLYTLGEFILLSLFYKTLIPKPAFFKKYFWYFISIGSILIILNSFIFESIYEFNPGAKTTVQIIIIGYAVLYFYNITENQNSDLVYGKSLGLINSAIIIYYSGSLFIFMCSQLYYKAPDLYKYFWAFNAVLNLIFQLLILSGIWKVVFRKTPSSS